MRTSDIVMGSKPTAYDMTESMYIKNNRQHPIPVEEMPTDQLMRGLCQKSRGNSDVCKTCPGGCKFGNEIVRREENAEEDHNQAYQ